MDVRTALKRLPVLQALPAIDREAFVSVGAVVELGPDEMIWERGEAATNFTFLIDGNVRLVVRAPVHGRGERECLIALVEAPGSLLCGAAVCGFSSYCCDSICTQRTSVLSLPREALAPRQDSSSAFLLNQVAARGMTLCRRVREVGGTRVEERVAAVLLRLADERGVQTDKGVKLPSIISRRDLAGLSGCATETLIRLLARFEERGGVVRSRRGLFVVPEVLVAIVGGADESGPT